MKFVQFISKGTLIQWSQALCTSGDPSRRLTARIWTSPPPWGRARSRRTSIKSGWLCGIIYFRPKLVAISSGKCWNTNIWSPVGGNGRKKFFCFWKTVEFIFQFCRFFQKEFCRSHLYHRTAIYFKPHHTQ